MPHRFPERVPQLRLAQPTTAGVSYEFSGTAEMRGNKVAKADRHAEARQVLKTLQDDPAAYTIA